MKSDAGGGGEDEKIENWIPDSGPLERPQSPGSSPEVDGRA